MDSRTAEALASVVAYMWEDERQDYDEQDSEGQENHIFLSLVTLNDYLARREGQE